MTTATPRVLTYRQRKELQRIDRGEPELFRGVRNRLAGYELAFRRNGVWRLTDKGKGLL